MGGAQALPWAKVLSQQDTAEAGASVDSPHSPCPPSLFHCVSVFSSYCAPKHIVTGETEGLCPLSEVGRGAAGGMRDGDWGTHRYKSQAGVRGGCFSGGEQEAYLVSDGGGGQ